MLSVQESENRDFLSFLETFLKAFKTFTIQHEDTNIHMLFYCVLGPPLNRGKMEQV